jgi:hypothetical protein
MLDDQDNDAKEWRVWCYQAEHGTTCTRVATIVDRVTQYYCT